MMLVAVTAFGGSLRAYSRIQVWGHDDMPNFAVHFDPDRSEDEVVGRCPGPIRVLARGGRGMGNRSGR